MLQEFRKGLASKIQRYQMNFDPPAFNVDLEYRNWTGQNILSPSTRPQIFLIPGDDRRYDTLKTNFIITIKGNMIQSKLLHYGTRVKIKAFIDFKKSPYKIFSDSGILEGRLVQNYIHDHKLEIDKLYDSKDFDKNNPLPQLFTEVYLMSLPEKKRDELLRDQLFGIGKEKLLKGIIQKFADSKKELEKEIKLAYQN